MKQFFSSFTGISVCFIGIMLTIKSAEIILSQSNGIYLSDLGAIILNGIPIGLELLVAFLLSFSFYKISGKISVAVATILLCVLALLEIGLCVYTARTGILMGMELVLRPVREILQTVVNAISVWHIAGVVTFITLYCVFSVILSKQKFSKIVEFFLVFLMAFSIPLFFLVLPLQNKKNVNKTWYCVRTCINGIRTNSTESFLGNNGVEADSVKIARYRQLFPNRCTDDKYLLERQNDIKNVLQPYFEKKSTKPNIVIIVVESLGSDLFGENEDKVSFTPFLRELSKKSLLWTNCLATTPRSFGAIPAITGSVPHGLKGFQFGNMPKHNSLFSIAQKNKYKTSAFYAGNYSFDRIYDYLVAQQIDYMSPLYEDFKNVSKTERDGTYWGYNDDVMLQKGLNEIRKRNNDTSYLDLFVTITQHEDLQLNDEQLQRTYYEKALDMVSHLSEYSKLLLQDKTGVLASTLYTDDALKHFFENYQNLESFKNTIFIITGDHSMNFNIKNPLDPYHVPLIIYSPMLETAKRFSAVISHLDITPSLTALLSGNFDFQSPQMIHWVNDGLDTSGVFQSKNQNYFLRYSREVRDGIFGSYYLATENGENSVYKIDEKLNVSLVEDKELCDSLLENFRTLVYVDNYVYSNDFLTKNVLLHEKDMDLLYAIDLDSVYCASPSEKPSISGKRYADIFKRTLYGESQELKIQIEADLMYTGDVWQDQFICIVFECKGTNISSIFSEDFISKYIQANSYKPNNWYKMKISKTLVVNQSNRLNMAIYLTTTHKDDIWNPDHSVLLKNVKMQILGD